MAAVEASPEAAFAAIAEDLLRDPDVQQGTGFGKNPGLRTGGTIFAMLVGEELVLKLPAERCSALAAADGARAFQVGQRRMREWVSIEPGGTQDLAALAREALAFVRG
ncbi:MAG TPA: hypothetical protein VES79_03765 [Solirubrobacteraceae bacterium]|nr:hypothetical protein [Solirubrobacteraceae bacterium]